MRINHIGYAVKRLDRAMSSFETLGFVFESVVDDDDRNVKIVFGENAGYRIELVCPLDKGKVSPVDSYLSDIGPTPYHICYQTSDFSAKLEELEKQGFKVIIPPKPAIAFGGRRVVFLMNLGLGLVELVEAERDKK